MYRVITGNPRINNQNYQENAMRWPFEKYFSWIIFSVFTWKYATYQTWNFENGDVLLTYNVLCIVSKKKRPMRLHIKPSITLTWIWLTRYLYNMYIHWWYPNCSDLQPSYYILYQKFEDGCIVNPIHMRFIKHN